MAAREETQMATSSNADEEPMEEDEGDDTDDSSSSSDDSEKDEDMLRRISELETQVDSNVYNYEPHVELIKLLRKDGELDKLRIARERMSQVFPLTENLWLDWLQDERKLATTDSEREDVNKLFQRAVQDYLSVDVWLEYVQFAIGQVGMADGVEKVRGVFEKALTAAGLHFVQGNVIWEAYREFENALLSALQLAPDAVMTERQQQEYEEQRRRVLNLFKRQLKVPFFDMANTFDEYKDWAADGMEEEVERTFKKTLKKMETIKPFEDALLIAEAPRLNEYQVYIDVELKANDPPRIQCLFERALSDNCLIPELWLKYIKYLETKLKIDTLSLPVLERSVRNCPWSVALWLAYLRAMERYNQPHEKIKELADRALASGFSTWEEVQQLWLTFLDYLRRRIDWEKDHTAELEELRSTYLRANSHLSKYFGESGDDSSSILRSWARIEAYHCKNMVKARELWNDVMLLGNNNRSSHMWLEYATLERACGDSKHLRAIFQKSLQAGTDWPEGIGNAWVTFEREEGTLEQWENAVAKYETKMTVFEERRKKELAASNISSSEHHHSIHERQRDHQMPAAAGNRKQKRNEKHLQRMGVKRKIGENEKESTKVEVDGDGFKIPFVSASAAEGGSGKWEKLVDEMNSDEPESKKTKMDSSGNHGESVPHDSSKDHLTVFLSNLDFSVSEEAIKKMFGEIGEIVQLRLVKDYKGRSKGYGYLQFKTKKHAAEALQKDREMLDGRPVFVSKCEDKKKSRDSLKPKLKYKTGLEKNKLFVRGLPYTTTKEELTDLFKPHGEVVDVRIVTYRNGRSKGLAFVDFKNEASASAALVKLDGTKIGDREISVAISSPPERKGGSGDSIPVSEMFSSSLGGGSKETGSRGRGRTQLALLPRSVQRPAKVDEASSSTNNVNGAQNGSNSSTSTLPAPRSNEEFRNLLLNK